MHIKIQQLKHFSLVVQKGGFRAASNTANRSQAALSNSIKELEKQLGHALFEPGYKAKLTAFGENCLPKIIQFLDDYNELNSHLKNAAEGKEGKVRIGSVPSVAAKFIPYIIGAFAESHPNVEVELIDENAARIEARLLAGKVDLTLGNPLQADNEHIEFTPLFSDPVGIVCLNNHPLTDFNGGLTWEQIAPYPFIKNGTCILLNATEGEAIVRKALYSVENITALYSFLERGIGITALPRLAFSSHTTQLQWIPLKSPQIQRNIGISRISKRHMPPHCKSFL